MTHKVVHVFRAAVTTGALILVASGCSGVTTNISPVLAPDPTIAPCDGVTVVVDERAISGTGGGGYADPTSTCVTADSTMTAQAALNASDVSSVTGTTDAGPAVVCRVDGTPNSTTAIAKPSGGVYFEQCETTPPDYAHWVVWHKSAGAGWDSTEQDITALDVAPGDAVALVFAYLSEPSTPSF